MTPTELRERQLQNMLWSTQDIRYNPMSCGYHEYMRNHDLLHNTRGSQNAYRPPEPTIQDQITKWQASLSEAASHPPNKHRDAAIEACHDVLAILDKMKTPRD